MEIRKNPLYLLRNFIRMTSLTDILIEKSRSGFYVDNAENKRLNRVGHPYGKMTQEGAPTKEEFARWKARKKEMIHKGLDPKKDSSLVEYGDDPGRQALREELISEVVSKAHKSHKGKPLAIFALGGAASGKSSSLRKMGYSSSDIPCQINPDDFQEDGFLDDNKFYNYMNPRSGAGRLHKETSAMAEEAFHRVLKTGGDFVKDGVMSNYDKSVLQIEEAIAHGYEPKIVGVTVDLEEALVRTRKRFDGTEKKSMYSGRWVPLREVRKGHKNSVNTFVRLWLDYHLPNMVLFDNNGSEPVKIFDSSKVPPVLDEVLMKRFLDKGGLGYKLPEFMKTKNDLVKSLESQNGSHDIFDILEKYYFQRQGEQYPASDEFADSEEELAEAKADFEWGNDGKPTGIKSDEEFYKIQRKVFGEIIYKIK